MGTAPPFELSGGALCLDFANTWGGRPDPGDERLHDYGDLLRWAHQADVVDADTVRRLEAVARTSPDVAMDVFARAVQLREAIYRIFSRLAAGGEVGPSDLAVLNDALQRALPRLRLRAGDGCCRWEWSAPDDAPDQMLWPVARSAALLLTGDDLFRVGECDSPTCAWLFVDRSRNRRRRWCDMSSCGNRAKARRYYERQREHGTP